MSGLVSAAGARAHADALDQDPYNSDGLDREEEDGAIPSGILSRAGAARGGADEKESSRERLSSRPPLEEEAFFFETSGST
jgi:hypothetical protein